MTAATLSLSRGGCGAPTRLPGREPRTMATAVCHGEGGPGDRAGAMYHRAITVSVAGTGTRGVCRPLGDNMAARTHECGGRGGVVRENRKASAQQSACLAVGRRVDAMRGREQARGVRHTRWLNLMHRDVAAAAVEAPSRECFKLKRRWAFLPDLIIMSDVASPVTSVSCCTLASATGP